MVKNFPVQIIDIFCKHEVDFIVVGDYSAFFYGIEVTNARAEVLYCEQGENLLRIIAALTELNACYRGTDTKLTECVLKSLQRHFFITDAGELDLFAKIGDEKSYDDIFKESVHYDQSCRIQNLESLIEMKQVEEEKGGLNVLFLKEFVGRIKKRRLDFKESIVKEIKDTLKQEKKELCFYDVTLDDIPEEMWELQQLEYLNLGITHISILPPGINKLKLLRCLVLVANKLKYLPPEMKNLTLLKTLYLSCNCLTSLPGEIIGSLINLETFSVENNLLTSIPEEIANCSKLKHLNLSGNYLSALPKQLGNLQELDTLYIARNHFLRIPEEIYDLNNLKFLELSENSIPFSEEEKRFVLERLPECEVHFEKRNLPSI